MIKQVLLVLAAVISVAPCTAAPYKKPLDAERVSKLSEAGVYAKVDERGVGVQHNAQSSSGVGSPYTDPTVNAAATVIADSILNSGTLEIASNGADKLAPAFDYEQTNARFNEALQAQLGQASLFGSSPAVQALDKERKWDANQFPEPLALLTNVEYSLTQDLRALEVVLTATVVSKDAVKLRKRGNRKGKPDEGIAYHNRIEYRSAPLPELPPKPAEEIEAEIEQIKQKYARAAQVKSNDRARANQTTAEREKGMKREIARARKPTPYMLSEHYVNAWLANDAVLLRNELQAGLAAVSELLVRDLQDTAPVDAPSKPPKTTIVPGDKRVVSRINVFPLQGVLVSEPVDYARPNSAGVTHARPKKAAEATTPASGQ